MRSRLLTALYLLGGRAELRALQSELARLRTLDYALDEVERDETRWLH